MLDWILDTVDLSLCTVPSPSTIRKILLAVDFIFSHVYFPYNFLPTICSWRTIR